MSDHTFSVSLKNVLKGMSDKQIQDIKYAVDYSMSAVYDNISTSVQDKGLSPYDNFRFTYGKKNKNRIHSNSRWYMRNRSSKVSISYELRNRAKYAKFLYSDEESHYHPNGWRSYSPHKEVKYREKDDQGKYNMRIYKRTSQLDSRLYNLKMKQYNTYVIKNVNKYLNGKQMKEKL